MNKAEIARAIECMREDGYSDQEIEEELEVAVEPVEEAASDQERGEADAMWVSCADCDALPGDPCKLSAEDIEAAIAIHACRMDHVHKFADLVDR